MTISTPADRIAPKRLNVFERYLTVWVALCMVAGVVLGNAVPAITSGLRTGVLIEVPVMLSVCGVCNRTRDWFPAIAHQA